MSSSLADHFGDFIVLTDSERADLIRFEERDRTLKRGAVLIRENDRLSDVFILRKGMMMSYVLLADGSRQILRFLFPGDMLAGAGMVYARSPETIVALTECTVCPFDRSAVARLIGDHPRLSATLMAIGQFERVVLTDRLAGLGRTSARTRVASVLLEIRNRMRRTDAGVDDGFVLGLTQEEIGDATGLTAVHVNRMLRQIEEEGLIARDHGRVRVLDEDALRCAANYVDRLEGIDLGWLPKAK